MNEPIDELEKNLKQLEINVKQTKVTIIISSYLFTFLLGIVVGLLLWGN